MSITRYGTGSTAAGGQPRPFARAVEADGWLHVSGQVPAVDGEIIEVTSHNKPIARIIGIPEQAEAGLRRLIASGAVSWGGGKPRHKLPVQVTSRGASVSQIVLEDRR